MTVSESVNETAGVDGSESGRPAAPAYLPAAPITWSATAIALAVVWVVGLAGAATWNLGRSGSGTDESAPLALALGVFLLVGAVALVIRTVVIRAWGRSLMASLAGSHASLVLPVLLTADLFRRFRATSQLTLTWIGAQLPPIIGLVIEGDALSLWNGSARRPEQLSRILFSQVRSVTIEDTTIGLKNFRAVTIEVDDGRARPIILRLPVVAIETFGVRSAPDDQVRRLIESFGARP